MLFLGFGLLPGECVTLGESWITAPFTVPLSHSLGLRWADAHSQRPSQHCYTCVLGVCLPLGAPQLALHPILQCSGLLSKPHP